MVKKYLSVEDHASEVLVEFLSRHVSVTLTIEQDGIRITARVSHGEDSSSWDNHEFFVPFAGDDSVSE